MMVTEMKKEEFLDFAAILKGPLKNRKHNTNEGVLNWRQGKYLHYENYFHIFYFIKRK